MIETILLCTDGEEHTRKAEDYAFELARRLDADLVGLYVVDPFLKKFTNEIYAVNREACRDHLDRQLLEQGKEALDALTQRAARENIRFASRVRHGPPEEEILKEIEEEAYGLVIMGAKLLKGWKQRFESVNLPRKIFATSPAPVLFVR
ncbi:MAG: universal stress protein [Syntrophobacteraceae bacterium]